MIFIVLYYIVLCRQVIIQRYVALLPHSIRSSRLRRYVYTHIYLLFYYSTLHCTTLHCQGIWHTTNNNNNIIYSLYSCDCTDWLTDWLTALGHDAANFRDVLCQMLDYLHPVNPLSITLEGRFRCRCRCR